MSRVTGMEIIMEKGNGFRHLSHAAQRLAVGNIIDDLLKKSPEKRASSILKIIDLTEFFLGDSLDNSLYEKARAGVSDPDSRWWKLINNMLDQTDPNVAKTFLLNLGYEAFLNGTKEIRKNREIYKCNIPWLILFDPTSACNMHCKGCWSGTYGDRYELSYEGMDKIVTEGKALGIHLYMMTGGEPLVRKADILKLAAKHSDVEFAIYTNSTLIDRLFCEEASKLGNLIFMLSIEGTQKTNDDRRGAGHYNAVMNAMSLLKEHGLIFGTSICYTSKNIEAVTDDEFFKLLIDCGAHFGFFFHYMPVGKNAVTELLPTPEQRRYMIERIRYIRSKDCDLEFYPMDFQNDGEFVGGCIAGGRNYFHINSAGDAEPCVFIHYSNVNIREASILDILRSPLFMAYHKGQPFNRNHLRPCPMLENPSLLRDMVLKTKAYNTNLECEESADELTAKCEDYADKWRPVAEDIWNSSEHKPLPYENYAEENRRQSV